MMRRLGGSRGATAAAATDDVGASLVIVARGFFAERGYANASLNAIVEAADLTKGAVYYYFPNKRELFREVYVAEQQRLTKAVVAAFREENDIWEAFHAGVAAFLRGLLDESVRRIILIDAPVALGWHEVRSAASPSNVALIRNGLNRAADAGLLPGHRVELLASLIYGAVCEAAHLVGNSEHPEETIEPMLAELRLTLDRLVDRSPTPVA
jgi:AcrR family transcriptional regulator